MALGVGGLSGCPLQPASGAIAADRDDSAQAGWSAELMEELEARGWEPPYFKGTVRMYPQDYHLSLARKALSMPAERDTLGRMAYRTSPALVAAGREIFHNY